MNSSAYSAQIMFFLKIKSLKSNHFESWKNQISNLNYYYNKLNNNIFKILIFDLLFSSKISFETIISLTSNNLLIIEPYHTQSLDYNEFN